MLNVKKRRKFRLIIGLVLVFIGWVLHDRLVSWIGFEVKNVGVSFGLAGDWVILVNFILLIYLGYFGWKKNSLGIFLMLLGGWVNFIDRLIFGYVRDYWWLGPVYNNVADWIISIGVGIFILEIWKKKLK